MRQVASFLDPKRVAVVGVSREKDKVGRIIFDHLSAHKRLIYGVNPNAKNINHQRIYADISLVPPRVELAVYAIPAVALVQEVEKAAKRGIKNHLIISSGFKEIGPEGLKREEELQHLIKIYHLSIQGPNCLGNISTVFNTNLSFGSKPLKGNIGLILQSGAIGTAFLDWAKEQKVGISHFVSLGNKVDLSENEFLEFMGTERNTKVIGIYLESLKNPALFLELAKKISRTKPLVVLRAGKTKESKMAISSHTGALAGSFASSEAAFSQVGIIEAQDLQQFFLLLELLGHDFAFAFSKTLVITNAGGPSVLLADNLSSHGFTPYMPDSREKQKLQNLGIRFRNPLDLLGDADPSRLKKALAAASYHHSDLLLFILLTPQENTDLMAMAKIIAEFQEKFRGTLIVNLVGGQRVSAAISFLKRKRVVVSTFVENLVEALAKIRNYQEKIKIKKERFISKLNINAQTKEKIATILKSARGFLGEENSLFIAKTYGLPLPKTYFLNSKNEALTVARKIGFPVVLKISTPDIIHRHLEHGVFLDIKSEKELETDFDILKLRKGKIILQKKVEADAEVIVGAKKDPEYSHLLAFGSGGIHVEYLKDIKFAVIPYFSYQTLEALMGETKISSFLENPKKLWPVFVSLINLLWDFPQIEEIDLNPVMIAKDQLRCVDVKIKV